LCSFDPKGWDFAADGLRISTVYRATAQPKRVGGRDREAGDAVGRMSSTRLAPYRPKAPEELEARLREMNVSMIVISTAALPRLSLLFRNSPPSSSGETTTHQGRQ